MFLRIACILLILVTLVSARVITWTAYSEESQTAADEEAIAGVARQISAKVDASTAVVRSEHESGDKSKSSKSIQVKNSIRSDIFLKGVRLQKLSKNGKKFGATATLDLDELTSSYRFNLETIQREVADIEASTQKAIETKLYAEAGRLLSEIPHKAEQYQVILDDMSVYVPLDNSMRLRTNATALQQALVKELLDLKIQVVNEMPFTVKVTKGDSAVDHFPLLAEHNGKPVAKAITGSDGTANFDISPKDLLNTPHELSIFPELSLGLRNAATIQAVKLRYQMSVPECKVNLSCKFAPTPCTAVLNKLTDTFGQVVQSSLATVTTVKIKATPSRSLKNLTSYNILLTLEHGDIRCQWSGTGTGRTIEEASTAAIKKMDTGSCLQTLGLCQ